MKPPRAVLALLFFVDVHVKTPYGPFPTVEGHLQQLLSSVFKV